jgi:hypothetical protein
MMATAGCSGYQGFFAQRFFLGMVEAGVSPMFMLVVSGFYRKHEQALRMGLWYCASKSTSVIHTDARTDGVGYSWIRLNHLSPHQLWPWTHLWRIAQLVAIQ